MTAADSILQMQIKQSLVSGGTFCPQKVVMLKYSSLFTADKSCPRLHHALGPGRLVLPKSPDQKFLTSYLWVSEYPFAS